MPTDSPASSATADKRWRLVAAAKVTEGLERREQLRRDRLATVAATRKRLDGMSDEERAHYKRDLLYRVARRRGASDEDARRTAIDFTRPSGSAVQLTRERRPGSTRSRGSRRGSTSSRSSGSRGDPDPGDSDPPAKKRRPCLNCAAFCESTAEYRGRRADLCPACIDRLADGQRPALAALERAYGAEAA
jgi:hypothetical protein